ncbi:MAG: ComEC family competence protein [Chitinophagales bacterium]|nr:ComEC family competence protein [Chitinophagales bacterium]
MNFLKFTIWLILGISLTDNLCYKLNVSVVFFLALIYLFSLLYTFKTGLFRDFLQYSLIALIAAVFHGIFFILPIKEHLKLAQKLKNQKVWITLEITEIPKKTKNAIKLETKILEILTQDTQKYRPDVSAIFYTKDTTKLKYGQIIQSQIYLNEVQPNQVNKNFDYQVYLNRNHIFYSGFIPEIKLLDSPSHSKSWKYIPKKIRDHFEGQLELHASEKESLNIIKAILIGLRTELSPETYDDYSNTGAIHILSISGLHFGVLMIVMNFFFSFVFPKGSILGFGIKQSLLMFYAIMTGFSPPIARSFFMFFLIDWNSAFYQKSSNNYNVLYFCAFILLLFDTNNVYDIGFQLTFVSLSGLMLSSDLTKKYVNKISNSISKFFINNLITICSATLFTLPFTLFYFHKMSFLGLLSNFFLVQLSAFTMYLGFGYLFFVQFCDYVAKYIYLALEYSVILQNKIIHFFAHIPFASFQRIFFDEIMFGLAFLALFCSFLMYLERKRVYRYCFYLSVLGLIAYRMGHKIQEHHQTWFYFKAKSSSFMYAYKIKDTAYIFSDDLSARDLDFFYQGYLIQKEIKYVRIFPPSFDFKISGVPFHIVDKSRAKLNSPSEGFHIFLPQVGLYFQEKYKNRAKAIKASYIALDYVVNEFELKRP